MVSQTRPRRVEALTDIQGRAGHPPTARPADAIVIAYAAYGEALRPEPVTPRWAFSSSSPSPAKVVTTNPGVRNRAPSPVPSPAVSTAPMTVGEKFGAWFKGRFMSPGAYLGAVAKGMWFELQDNDDFKKDTFKNYMADSMTRAARSFASSTTYAFYEKALLASAFKQDPRYHRSNKTGAGAKLWYAATRVFVTQGDRCGCDQFNASFLLGGAMGAVTANGWERSERTGRMHTTERWLNHIMFRALGNILREFIGGQ